MSENPYSFPIDLLSPGWVFINLFHDVAAGLYYCRIRHGTSPKDREVTASGATPWISMSNAVKKALEP